MYPVKICFILPILLALTSCAITLPEYKSTDHFSYGTEDGQPAVKAQVHLYNPNPVGIKLKEMNVSIAVNDSMVGSAALDDAVRIKRHEEFTLPFTFATSFDQLTQVTVAGIGAIFGKPVAVEIYGQMTLKKFFIFKKTLTFSYSDELSGSDIIKH